MKALNIIGTAYRATLEEQDDTIVWLTHAMTGAGADLDVLLQGSAVNYAVRSQKISPLNIGGRAQKQSPQLADDLAGLLPKGVDVYVVKEDLADRGIKQGELIDGPKFVSRNEVADLFGKYDRVWQW